MRFLRTIVSIPLTILFYIGFASLLLIFHFIQVFSYYLLGKKSHKVSVDWLNFFLMHSLMLLGTRIKVMGLEKLPENRSIVIVSNHQSMMDIPPIIWLLRKHHVKFIAKKELTNLVPSISFNLKKGGSLLIDRKKGKESVEQMRQYATKLVDRKISVCIFPEGTRSKSGQLKEFKAGGLIALADGAKDVPIVPFIVHGNNKIFGKGMFPLQIGQKVMYEVLDPINTNEYQLEELTKETRLRIEEALLERQIN